MLANESKRIRKGGQGFGIPGGLSNGKRLSIQELMGKQGDKRKESQQGRSRAHNRQIRPLALGLDAQMSTHLMKGDFDRPAQDKPLHDLDSFRVLVGAKQGHWLILSFWIANEYPTDRDRGNGGLIPQSRASGDLHLSRCSPIAGQRLFLPDGLGVDEALGELGLRLAFEGIATSFSCFTRRSRIVQAGIQAQDRSEKRLNVTRREAAKRKAREDVNQAVERIVRE